MIEKNRIVNPISLKIWEDRYQFNGETYEESLKRVSDYISSKPKDSDELFELMDKGLFFPAGRTMCNAGIGKNLTLNNCFNFNSVGDSISEIFDAVKVGSLTHQAGGGIGYDFTHIRPNGTPTSNNATASGVVSFLQVFDAQTKTILASGRRGANLSALNIYHPDIYEYLESKSYDEGKLTQFNLSVMVDDNFMKAVENDENVFLRYPVYDENNHIITDESKWKVKEEIRALDLWNLLMKKVYDTGEYGVFFYENMNEDNPTYYAETITSSNPCGEYLSGVLKFDFAKLKKVNPEDYKGACNLGSIFVHKHVLKPFTQNAKIDWDELRKTIKISVRALDGIIDINKFPLEAYENYQKAFRTIGLGVTGIANTLAMLNVNYGSEESVDVVDNIMEFVAYEAYMASIELAKEKGEFEFIDRKKHTECGFIQKHLKNGMYPWQNVVDGILKHGIRNARILSVAPVGTLSLTYGNNCSSGCEPTFSLSYQRKVKIGGQSDENVQIVDFTDYAYSEWLKVKDNKDTIVKESVFDTALNIGVDKHIAILEVIAKHTDMSVSKTINIPTEYSFEETKQVYMDCWKKKIKGATIFRPNEIRKGVMITEDMKETVEEPNQLQTLEWGTVIDSSDDLLGRKTKIQTGCGSLHISGFFDEYTGELQEVFLNKGGTGGCLGFMGGLSRMISLSLRAGVPFETVFEQLTSVQGCPSYVVRTKVNKDTSKGSNCSSAIGYALKKMLDDVRYDLGILEEADIQIKQGNNKPVVQLKRSMDYEGEEFYEVCPECGEKSPRSSSCFSCANCGYSKCS